MAISAKNFVVENRLNSLLVNRLIGDFSSCLGCAGYVAPLLPPIQRDHALRWQDLLWPEERSAVRCEGCIDQSAAEMFRERGTADADTLCENSRRDNSFRLRLHFSPLQPCQPSARGRSPSRSANTGVNSCCPAPPKNRNGQGSEFWKPELLSSTRLFSLYAKAVLLWSIEGLIYLEKSNSWTNRAAS